MNFISRNIGTMRKNTGTLIVVIKATGIEINV
jgi:hypothetical protein